MAKEHGSFGSMPKAKRGTGRTMDHTSCGRMVGASNQTSQPTTFAGGKGPRMDGGKGKAVASPKVRKAGGV